MPHAPGGTSLHKNSQREGSAVGEAFPPSKKPKPQRGNPIAPPGNILAPPDEAAPLQASSSSASAGEAAPTGAVIAQFETSTGERSGPQLDVPLDTSPAQLQLIINSLLANDDKVPYSFYVAEAEVTANLSAAIGDASTEQVIRIVYVPQAVFRVRAVARCTSTLPGHAEAILSTSFSADGSMLATGSGDHTVRLWDARTELPKATLKAHKDWVLCIAWSACNRYLISGGKDGMVAVWAPPQVAPVKVINAHKKWVNALAWEPLHADPEQGRFCSASKDGTARVWDRVSGRCLFSLQGHVSSVSCVRWGGEGLLFTGSHDRTCKVWAAEDQGKLVRTLEGHAHWVNCLALSTDAALRAGAHDHRGSAPLAPADAAAAAKKRYAEAREAAGGELLASGSDDFTCFLWSPAAGKKPITRMTGHVQLVNNVAFSPDAQWLASASFDGAVRLWAARTGKFVATLRGHVGAVYQLAWSGDSRLLASGSKDSTIKVWSVQTRKLKEELPGHADEVYAVDWSPDGRHVASGGKDRNLKMWQN